MSTIFKYNVQQHGSFAVSMPEDAEILHFAVQRGQWFVWALVNSAKPVVDRHFHASYTGEYVGSDVLEYVGTAEYEGVVVHLFDLGEWR